MGWISGGVCLLGGVNVVLTMRCSDDLYLQYFVEAGAMAARRCRKEDSRGSLRQSEVRSCDRHVTGNQTVLGVGGGTGVWWAEDGH